MSTITFRRRQSAKLFESVSMSLQEESLRHRNQVNDLRSTIDILQAKTDTLEKEAAHRSNGYELTISELQQTQLFNNSTIEFLSNKLETLRSTNMMLQQQMDHERSQWTIKLSDQKSYYEHILLGSTIIGESEFESRLREPLLDEPLLEPSAKNVTTTTTTSTSTSTSTSTTNTTTVANNIGTGKQRVHWTTKVNNEVKVLRGEVKQKDQIINELQTENNVLKVTLHGYQEQRVLNKNEIYQLSQQVQLLNSTLDRKEQMITTHAQVMKQLQSETLNVKNKYGCMISELESRISELNTQMCKQKQELEDLYIQVDSSTAIVSDNNHNHNHNTNTTYHESTDKSSNTSNNKIVNVLCETIKQLRADLDVVRLQSIQSITETSQSMHTIVHALEKQIHNQSFLLTETMQKYHRELSERRKYYNMVQDLKGNLRVLCRIRPMLPGEIVSSAVIQTSETNSQECRIQARGKTQRFEFDHVFTPSSTQEHVFHEVKELITSVMDGYNVCIFAYGQTNSGKSYTINGLNECALRELFQLTQLRQSSHDHMYCIKVSMSEVYNENVYDLLIPRSKELKIRQKVDEQQQPQQPQVYVENLSQLVVENEEDVQDIITQGMKNRMIAATASNKASSRSHTLLTINVTGTHISNGTKFDSKLVLVDLAGSERLSKSMVQGERLAETLAINKSLSALGNVIEALQSKRKHIPYRDSTLTFLLSDCLGGRAKTLMFVNVSPCFADADESLCSLSFAERASKVEFGKITKTPQCSRRTTPCSIASSSVETPLSSRAHVAMMHSTPA